MTENKSSTAFWSNIGEGIGYAIVAVGSAMAFAIVVWAVMGLPAFWK